MSPEEEEKALKEIKGLYDLLWITISIKFCLNN